MIKEISQFPKGPILDSRGRVARYLRISITDRCNLHCAYCRNMEKDNFIPHSRILKFEQFIRLARIVRRLGIGKIRITGGEPFVRKGCMQFIYDLRKALPDIRLSVTTNGTLIYPLLEDLCKARLASVNISIDSFAPAIYARLTGADLLQVVQTNMEKLIAMGQKVKINAVAIKGITDEQVDDFIKVARELPVDIRFIEFMPMGRGTLLNKEKFLSCDSLERLIASREKLEPVSFGAEQQFSGPARMFAIKNAPGRIGFIAAMNGHFCGSCNRLRVTSEGHLRVCLFADREYALAPMLANPAVSDYSIARAITGACLRKPLGSAILASAGSSAIAKKQMTGIGG